VSYTGTPFDKVLLVKVPEDAKGAEKRRAGMDIQHAFKQATKHSLVIVARFGQRRRERGIEVAHVSQC
jgi:hypothetical protein